MATEHYQSERETPMVLNVTAGSSRHTPQVYSPGERMPQAQAVRTASQFISTGSASAARGTISIRSLLTILFSRWQRVGTVALCVLFFTLLGVVFLPPHYRSEAKLLVRLGRESVVIDPTARIGQSAVPMEGRDKEINSEIELLKGRQLIEAAVNSIGANRILSLSPNTPAKPQNVDKAITLVENKLIIEAVPESNVLSIQFEARDPQTARDVIAKLIDAYLDTRAAVYRDQGDQKFFQDQLATARDEQAKIQKQIQDLRDSSGVADPAAQRTALLKHRNDLQDDIDKDHADRAAQAASANAVIHQMGSANAEQQRVYQVARESQLDSMIRSLQTQKDQADTDLAHVNDVDVKMQKLTDEETLSAARVKQYAEAYEQTRIDREMGQQRLSNISIAEPPVLPLTPKAPSRGLLVIAGLFLALTLGVGSAFVAEAMDHTVRGASDMQLLGLAQTVSIPVLTKTELKPHFKRWELPRITQTNGHAQTNGKLDHDIIDHIEENGLQFDIAAAAPEIRTAIEDRVKRNSSPVKTNGYHPSLTNIATSVVGVAIRPAGVLGISDKMMDCVQGITERLIPAKYNESAPRLIGVIGPRAGMGVSTIAFHLAVSLSQMMEARLQDSASAERVLLLDTDLQTNRASEMAGLAPLTHLEQPDTDAPSFPLYSTTCPDGNHHLDVLTASLRYKTKSQLAAQMPELLKALSLRYRQVVIDLPAISEDESAVRYAGLCSTIIFVCKADELRSETVRQTLTRLREVHANVSIAVLNQRRYPVPEWIYRRS